MGREARANPTAVAAREGKIPAKRRMAVARDEADDQEYLAFLAEQITTADQFNAIVAQADPKLRSHVRRVIWEKLKPEVQALIPNPSGVAPA